MRCLSRREIFVFVSWKRGLSLGFIFIDTLYYHIYLIHPAQVSHKLSYLLLFNFEFAPRPPKPTLKYACLDSIVQRCITGVIEQYQKKPLHGLKVGLKERHDNYIFLASNYVLYLPIVS